MIIGIDASNIKSDGGIVHLFELINNFNFKYTKIKKIIIWGNSKSLKKIKINSKIYKIKIDKFSSNKLFIILWQLLFLPYVLKKNNCNVLYVLGGVFFKKTIPTVSIFQNILPFIKDQTKKYNLLNRIKLNIQKKIYIKTFSKSDGLIFLSNFSKKILSKELNLHKKKIKIIPHGVSDIFRYKKRKINKKNIKIIYVSKIDIYKNQSKIILALKGLKKKFNIRLTLVGSFDYQNKKILMNKINELNMSDDVKILGKVNYEKLPDLYNQHDIKIYASKSETFGMTMLEAMKCGLPILATKNQISTEILSNAGFFCKDTVEDIKIGLVKIINDKEKLKTKIKKGVELSSNYKWINASKSTFDFLESLGN
ncbi:glycosyltransferase [Candidatus Pelagibacter sp.]|nr:glycosyltransferase [Candidatus Pelagibacter sp.]